MLITIMSDTNTTLVEGVPGVKGTISNSDTMPGLSITDDKTASDMSPGGAETLPLGTLSIEESSGLKPNTAGSGESGGRITEQPNRELSSSISLPGMSESANEISDTTISAAGSGPDAVLDPPESTAPEKTGPNSRRESSPLESGAGMTTDSGPSSPFPSTSAASTLQSVEQPQTPRTGTTNGNLPGSVTALYTPTIVTGLPSSITSAASIPAGTDDRSTSTTSSRASSSTISTVLLSIEFSAEANNGTLARRSSYWKRDDTSGFVGDENYQNPDTCSSATLFRQGNGQLVSRQRPLSVDPGVDYINLSDYPGGSISTTFAVIGRVLFWNNTAFYGGSARFCQLQSGAVYGLFTENPGPDNCTFINLVVYTGGLYPFSYRFVLC